MIIDRIFHKINSSESHPYYYLSPHVYAIGNCALELWLGLIKAKNKKKRLVILYPFDIPSIFKYKLTNKALFKLSSDLLVRQNKHTTLLIRALVTIIYLPLRVAGLFLRRFTSFNLDESYHFPRIGICDLFIPEKSGKIFSFKSVQEYNWSEKFNTKLGVDVTPNGNHCASDIKKRIGIPANTWFVCLHVREAGWHGDRVGQEHRNSDILNFIPAIKEITSRGGWVVRMGDNTMKPLPSMPNVVDYPFTRHKSDFSDLCLIQNCLFYIGTQSGLLDVAKLFEKNILMVNVTSWLVGAPLRIKDRGICKHVYSKKEKRYLSLKELFSIDWETDQYGITDQNYVYVENSGDEILQAVSEYIDFLKNGDLSLTPKQREAIKYLKEQAYRMFEQNKLIFAKNKTDEDKLVDRYKVAAEAEGSQLIFCTSFLEKYWNGELRL